MSIISFTVDFVFLFIKVSFHLRWNRIGYVIACVLVPSVVDRGSSSDRVKPKTIKFVFVVSPLSTQHRGERAKSGWLRIRIVCPSGMTCLSTDCCFSELAL